MNLLESLQKSNFTLEEVQFLIQSCEEDLIMIDSFLQKMSVIEQLENFIGENKIKAFMLSENNQPIEESREKLIEQTKEANKRKILYETIINKLKMIEECLK